MVRVLAAGLVVVALLAAGCAGLVDRPQILLATTTSTQDSGLLDVLEPAFEDATGREVGIVAVGSGQALEMGRRGDADVLLVHSPRAERRFMADGHGLERIHVFSNRFVVVGPEADPAGVAEANATGALVRVHANASTFVSRGDSSGTHAREVRLWEDAGMEPTGFGGWYQATGQGMGPTLIVANERPGYTLTDEATWLNVSANLDDRLRIEVLVDGDPALTNPYHVIPVHDRGRVVADWLTDDRARELVRTFTLQGRPVFEIPDEAP